ncbi:MAG: hypothetical protein ACODAF_00940 [Actinomycetota bacterium]
MSADQLGEELRTLGRTLEIPTVDADALANRVVAQLDEAVPRSTPARRRRLRAALVAAAVAVLLALALTPPVRAAVSEWFGVLVRQGPPAESQPVPGAESALTLEAAAEIVGFAPVEAPMLGEPDGVEVSSDGRVLSMSWSEPEGTVRLEQFEGRLEPFFVKHADAGAEIVRVGGGSAVWFDRPHHITALDEDGRERVATSRTAGPTLLWQVGDVTLRLEGADRERSIDVAEAVTEAGT